MSASIRLEKELALIDVGYACFAIPKFRGQKEEFTGWLSKVERVFTCCDLNDQEEFKVVISRLRGYALEWWINYKLKRRSQGKEKVRTWKKLRSKLNGAFSPSTYIPMKENISIPPTASFPSTPQKNQAPQNSLPSQPKPKPLSKSITRCSKCQGFGHLTTDCPNNKVVTLKEWEAVREEEEQEEPKEVLKEEEQEEPKEVLKEVKEEAYGGSHANDVFHSKAEIPAPMCDLFFTPSEPLSTHPSLTPFKEWVFNDPKKPRLPFSNHPITFPQNHSIRTKQDLFVWLILFQPFSSPHHPPYCPMFSFLFYKPLIRKFYHKDKWKEPYPCPLITYQI